MRLGAEPTGADDGVGRLAEYRSTDEGTVPEELKMLVSLIASQVAGYRYLPSPRQRAEKGSYI